MKPWMHLWLAMMSIAPLPAAIAQDVRSARPSPPPSTTPVNFDRSQSAALFVGVRRFTHDQTLTEVKYAVDDAIDLASVLALDRKVSLVTPRRVVLALSGTPQKPESQQRLDPTHRRRRDGERGQPGGQLSFWRARPDWPAKKVC